jgi:hypothetical protein
MDMQTPIKLDLTLEEVTGICIALGDLPTKTNAFMLIAKINAQIQPQLPKEESQVDDVNSEDIKSN